VHLHHTSNQNRLLTKDSDNVPLLKDEDNEVVLCVGFLWGRLGLTSGSLLTRPGVVAFDRLLLLLLLVLHSSSGIAKNLSGAPRQWQAHTAVASTSVNRRDDSLKVRSNAVPLGVVCGVMVVEPPWFDLWWRVPAPLSHLPTPLDRCTQRVAPACSYVEV
jgi:hypothetical protein